MKSNEYTTDSRPALSIVVIVFNMRREAPRTLFSLSADYQEAVRHEDYEVIVIDNGSGDPLTEEEVTRSGPNFRYFQVEDALPSPAAAINFGVSKSRAPNIGIMIDGARLASPGVVSLALTALDGFSRTVVSTLGFHLGPDIQTRSILDGYNRDVEDGLLTGIDWRRNGYRLFEISALGGSSPEGWFGSISESNLLFMPRKIFDELEGFDEKFDIPGGGFVNLDFYKRTCELPATTMITLLGEATFHQVHGGTIANMPQHKIADELAIYDRQYKSLRGAPFSRPNRLPLLFGSIRPEVLPCIKGTLDSIT